MVNRIVLDPRSVAVLFCIAVAIGCKKAPDPRAETGVDTTRLGPAPNEECPHGEGFRLIINGKQYSARDFQNTMAVIPEYNDCQALVVDNEYGPRVAIFAYDRLSPAMLTAPDSSDPVGPTTVAVALIVNLETVTPYGPLGIQPGFNCLYIWQDQVQPPRRTGRVVPVKDKDECDIAVDPLTKPGTVLDVQRKRTVNLTTADYPGVARWGWDPDSSVHYIGIKCGDAWCSAGPAGFIGDKNIVPELGWTFADPRPTPIQIARVFAANGWYDRQHLAIKDANGDLQVGGEAIVFPHPRLGMTKNVAEFDSLEAGLPGHWVPAAYVWFPDTSTPYKEKWNFEKGWNRISLCSGDPGYCNIPAGEKPNCTTNDWWVRVEAARTKEIVYRCVLYTNHNMEVPGTVRWRWDPEDEKLWIRCPQGCCQVN